MSKQFLLYDLVFSKLVLDTVKLYESLITLIMAQATSTTSIQHEIDEQRLKELERSKKQLEIDEKLSTDGINNTFRLIDNEQRPMEELNSLLTTNCHRQDAIENEIIQQENDFDENETKLFDVTMKLNQLETCRDQYNDQIFDLELRQQSNNFERQHIEQNIQTSQTHIDDLQENINEKIRLMQDNQVNITLIRHEVDEIIQDIALNEQEQNLLDERLDQLKEQLSLITSESIKLDAELRRLEDSIERIKETIKTKQEQTEILQKDDANLKDQLKQAEQTQIEIQKVIGQLTDEIKEKTETIESLKSELKEILKTIFDQEKQVRLSREALEQSKYKTSRQQIIRRYFLRFVL